MIALLEQGPDATVNQAAADAVSYRDDTIQGWTCLMTPLPPMQNGRIYLESLDCYRSNGAKSVSEQDFSSAGEIFKRNLDAFYKCFGDDLMSETPVSYVRTTRGEGIIGLLKNSYRRRHILVTYGYLQDSSRHTPLTWQTIVGYSKQ